MRKTFIKSYISRNEETGHYKVIIMRLGLCGVRSVVYEHSGINSLLDARAISNAALETVK